MNKPQTFSILGKEHQLKSIWEDLKELGYKQTFSFIEDINNWEYISNYFYNWKDKSDFIQLDHEAPIYDKMDKTFQLPQQYQEALDFAKEQINHSYWSQDEYKEGDWVTVIGYDERYSYSLYHGELGKSYLITKINKSGLFFNETDCLCKTVIKVRKATEEEIKSELLKQANEKYPVGCSFRAVKTGTVIKNNGNIGWYPDCDKESIFANSGYGALYIDGKWAEIIKNKTLYFGEVEFTIYNNKYATTGYGKITKEELKTAIDYIKNPPVLCGHRLTLHTDKGKTFLNILDDKLGIRLGFGCQSGKLSELIEIYNAICEF